MKFKVWLNQKMNEEGTSTASIAIFARPVGMVRRIPQDKKKKENKDV